ncbi:hypothetical protein [Candidatus Magnetomonas plexicatena]|uniref:hypothetical protein n=1 Tax=Candidatus Magnetomonas plexicatena TaxID=2552947 RepID=UPI001C77A778|nr:hypothetical protein E2O03_005250 [Nitrospirales bacterium LBB_01]
MPIVNKATPIRNFLYVMLFVGMLATIICGSDTFCSALEGATDSSVIYTNVYSNGSGNVLIKITSPATTRYTEGAPVIIYIPATDMEPVTFSDNTYINSLGFITVEFLWPDHTTNIEGIDVTSEGVFDYGGQNTILALRDVVLFILGVTKNTDGFYISDILSVTPLLSDVGIYAYSHTGMEATNLLARHGSAIKNLAYLVTMESPTEDKMFAMEVGNYDYQGIPTYNPYYNYPNNYGSNGLNLDYTTLGWCVDVNLYPEGRPCFNSKTSNPFVLSSEFQTMFGKRVYSAPLTDALYKNVFISGQWPLDVATPDEAALLWSYRSVSRLYPLLVSMNLETKIMLVFTAHDHVQTAKDKPHIHQAYDGFHKTAGLWVRLNPDSSYMKLTDSSLNTSQIPDNDANTEPTDWQFSEFWGYSTSVTTFNHKKPFAAILEMADRVYMNDWSNNLQDVLVNY